MTNVTKDVKPPSHLETLIDELRHANNENIDLLIRLDIVIRRIEEESIQDVQNLVGNDIKTGPGLMTDISVQLEAYRGHNRRLRCQIEKLEKMI
jgi:hypothetical protein